AGYLNHQVSRDSKLFILYKTAIPEFVALKILQLPLLPWCWLMEFSACGSFRAHGKIPKFLNKSQRLMCA
uniref:hypothetical protein n=1 Tax=Klebsiella pneumoniae TaxID=573 RepID=UPI0024DEA912